MKLDLGISIAAGGGLSSIGIKLNDLDFQNNRAWVTGASLARG